MYLYSCFVVCFPDNAVQVMQAQANMGCAAGVLGLLLFIPCFSLGSGLYGDYPPMHDAGLKMLHDMYLDTRNTTGFWEALQVYRDSSAYRLVHPHTPCSTHLGSCLYEQPQFNSLARRQFGGLLFVCPRQKSFAVNTSCFWKLCRSSETPVLTIWHVHSYRPNLMSLLLMCKPMGSNASLQRLQAYIDFDANYTGFPL